KRSLFAVFISCIIEPGIVIQCPGIVAAIGIIQAKRPFLIASPLRLSTESSAEVKLMKDRKTGIVPLVEEKFQPGIGRWQGEPMTAAKIPVPREAPFFVQPVVQVQFQVMPTIKPAEVPVAVIEIVKPVL